MAIRGGMVGSIAKLKSAVKRGSGGWIANITDGETDYRFLTEPDQWCGYLEHYDEVRKFYPCDDQDCPGCREGNRASQRWLASALDMTNDKNQIILKLPKSIIGILTKYYEKYQTITDRDYTLEREGTGLETTYTAIPLAPHRMNLSRYDLPDLEKVLREQLAPEGDDEEDEDDDGRPLPPPARNRKAATKVVRRRTVVEEEEDDYDDEEEEPAPRRKSAPSSNGGAKRIAPPVRDRSTPLPRPGQARREAEERAAREQPHRNGSARPLPKKAAPAARPRPVKRYDDDPPF